MKYCTAEVDRVTERWRRCGQVIASLPWFPPVDVAPENTGELAARDRSDSIVPENNNTRVMWMRGAARIQKQVS